MKSLVSKTTGFLAIVLMLLVAPSGVALANQGATSEAVAGQAIVKYLGTGEPSAKDLGVLSVTKVGKENYLVQLDPFLSQGSELARLESRKDVDYAEPNYVVELTSADDPSYVDGSLWGMAGANTTPTSSNGANADGAWAKGYTGNRQVYVAVIDSGIDVSHPGLAGNMWVNSGEVAGDGIDNDGNGYIDDVNGFDFLNGDGSVFDVGEHPHGTHVAGTIGAVGNNGVGVAGVMWSVNLISAKTINASGQADLASTIQAIDYITDLRTQKGLDIIASNNSWGGTRYSQALENAIKRGGDAGIMFVAAAGNDAGNIDSTPQYPAAYDCSTTHRIFDCVVSVAAIQEDGGLASYSNFGSTGVDVAAPGTNVLSTTPGDSYGVLSGTSMAAPHVTGALALCVASYRGTSGLSAIQKLMSTATANAALSGKVASGGQLNVEALVDSCVGSATAFAGNLTNALGSAEYTDRARLDWLDTSAGDYEQEIQVAVGPNGCRGTFSHLAYIGPGLDSFPIHDLEEAQFYCFRVRAIKDAEVSAWATSNVTITWTSNLPFISGKVLTSDGVPVQRMPVKWLAEGAYAGLNNDNASTVYTNDSGEYVMQVSNGTPGRLFANTSRFANRGLDTTPPTPWGMEVGGDLTISQDTVVNITLPVLTNLSIRIVDDSNNPVAGASIETNYTKSCTQGTYLPFAQAEDVICTFWPAGYAHSGPKTDANGQVTIAVFDQQYLRDSNFAFIVKDPTNPNRATNFSWAPGQATSFSVLMNPPATLTGRVLMADGVTTVANAPVKWLNSGQYAGNNFENALSVVTNSSGEYSIQVPSGGSGKLFVNTSRFPSRDPATSPVIPWGLEAGGEISVSESMSVDITLPEQNLVTFRVTDGSTDTPVANAKVEFAGYTKSCIRNSYTPFASASNVVCTSWPTGYAFAQPTTNAQGELQLALLSHELLSDDNHSFLVKVTSPASTTPITIAPTSDQTVDVVINPPAVLSGQVFTSDGVAVSGIAVKWLNDGEYAGLNYENAKTSVTNASGEYTLEVPAGSQGSLFVATSRTPNRSAHTSPKTPWGLYAGGKLTPTMSKTINITLPAQELVTFQVEEYASNLAIAGATVEYAGYTKSCKRNSYTAFPGAVSSDCSFWPGGYAHSEPITNAQGQVEIALIAPALVADSSYAWNVTHPLDAARVANVVFTLTQSATVRVEMPGTPSQPEQPDATPLTNEVRLAWDEPWNGGAFIDYYKVWISLNADGPFTLVDSGSCAGNIAPELRECVVTGLTAGVTYYFAIIAHNVVGYSDRSLSIAATPLAPVSIMTKSPTPSVSGVAEVGRALTAITGTWDAGVELSYQWLRDSAPIQGAVRSTYLVAPRDAGTQISVEITGRKTGFTSITRTSAAVAPTWPTAVQLVAINGNAAPGQLLTVETSELIANESLSFQWQRDGEAISGADQPYYEVSGQDVGSALTVKVVASVLSTLPLGAVTDTLEVAGTVTAAEELRPARQLSTFSPTVSPSISPEATQSPTASPAVGRWFEQKTIRVFARNATTLTAAQKAVIKNMVEEHDSADKFICTGIRREGGTRAENIMVRLRAKAACEYAKELNPELSTWYQSKATKASSYVGRVLLVAKGVKEPE